LDAPYIESYRFGRIVVDRKPYSRDLIILPTGVLSDWWRQEGHALHPADLNPVLKARPDVLVVGLGAYGRVHVTAESREALEAEGIELVAQTTKKACETYNSLRQEKIAAAALHLTC
jgi:hypothetical protein